MKIKHFFLSGDTHGWKGLLGRIQLLKTPPEETALIILGDAGINYWLNNSDKKGKSILNSFGYTIYCVRGNHEQRPELIPTVKSFWDNEVSGFVYYEEDYPYIRYFEDGSVYYINGYRTLVIGGAYSVDKYWRLANGNQWFDQEQLTQVEMDRIAREYRFNDFDLVLSHTCPYSWRPTDLFLSTVDQTTVDNTMELWMNDFKDVIDYRVWAFGHYHDDRLVRPGVVMLYKEIINLNDIHNPNLTKGPQYDYE